MSFAKIKGYLVPHPPLLIPGVGKGNEIPNTRKAMEKIACEIKELNPETVIIISPHSILYGDYFHISPGGSGEGDLGKFGVKNIKFAVDYDQEFARTIALFAGVAGLPAGSLGEREPALDHGVMVPLHFVKAKRIIRISLSGLSALEHYRFGMCIAKAGEKLDRSYVVIASGDMSHKLKSEGPYGYAAEGPQFDNLIRTCVENGEWQKVMQIDPDFAENAAECGLKSLVMMLGVFDGQKIDSRVLCYEGPFGVGYLTASFKSAGMANEVSLYKEILHRREETMQQTRAQEDEYVRLARFSVEHFTRTGKTLAVPKDLSKALLDMRAGVFVSLKKDGNLRGCIGTTGPTTKSIAEEIIQNAVSACSRDGRFETVRESELGTLVYSVDVLFPPESIKNKSDLNVNRYGVIVRCGRRSGLLLPALAGINTVEDQISIALRKAGINSDESYTLERFEVVRHK